MEFILKGVADDDTPDEFSRAIRQFLELSEAGILVSRRPFEDKDVYVQLTRNSDREEEHGFQIGLRRGKELARGSEQDGHLTTADAYGLPEEQNTTT